jgi:isoquinoline 1-oxidoreductase alpha subunit
VPVGQIKENDQIVTIEGLAATVDKPLHPMQEAWIEYDVAQCGYCQPGQIMTAVALVENVHAQGRQITDADLNEIRNICRCGTYPRIREAIMAGAEKMGKPVRHKPAHHAHRHQKPEHRSRPGSTRTPAGR